MADSPDAVLQEVRKLEAEGRVWDVLVAESYPPRIHVTGPWPEIQQLKAVAGLPYFVTIAEAMTSPDPATGIDAGYRLFSVPSLPQLCTAGPARLRIHNAPGSLRIGEPYPLGQLVVTAEDADGELLSAVPIRLDAEVTLPAVVDLRAEALADGMLVPIAAGDFAIRAQTVCPATSAVAVTYASVLHDQ